jgi:mycothiol S-conjugate amidase
VHAHPDDESSKGAATYARYSSEGAQVLIVSCTGGERGDVQNEAVVERAMAERDMAGLRRVEMARAAAIMGIEHRWLGFTDSGLPSNGEALQPHAFAMIPLELSGPPLVRIIRSFQPDVVVTYDETGGYPHPDHIRTHELTVWALAAAASSQYPELGSPWSVAKLYYDRIFSGDRVRAVLAAMQARNPDDPRVAELTGTLDWLGDRGSGATTRVDVGDFLDIRDAALRAHASQVAPDDRFFFWPNDVQREAWPWEEFELVSSTVPSTVPETDLFAGLPED